MQIEITEKEKTALSILLGLRQKFAREKKNKETYSAAELHKLFSELIQKINKGELQLIQSLNDVNAANEIHDAVWDEINEAVSRSKIKRYDWNKVFDKSLTAAILILKKNGYKVDDAYKELKNNPKVIKFIEDHPKSEKKHILKNLKISVHARYGENNTAFKIMSDEELTEDEE